MIFYYHNDIDANMILYNLNLDEVNQLTKYLSELIYAPMIIGFTGDLGTGKTQFIKFLLNNYIKDEIIKSPTFSLIEEYSSKEYDFIHMDLYRVSDREIIEMGIIDNFSNRAICLIEWVEKNTFLMNKIDIHIKIEFVNNETRSFEFFALNQKFTPLIENLSIKFKK